MIIGLQHPITIEVNATITVRPADFSVTPVEPEPTPDPTPEPEPTPEPDPTPEPTSEPEPAWDGDGNTGHPLDFPPDPNFDPTPTAPELSGFENPIGPWTVPDIPQSRMPRFVFEGGWRHESAPAQDPANHTHAVKCAFSVTSDSVWMANSRTVEKSIIRFHRPDPVITTNPAEMPIAGRMQDGFFIDPELDVNDCHICGVFYDELTGKLIVSNFEVYDAGRDNTRFLAVMNTDGTDQRKWFNANHGSLAVGQVLKTPAELVDRIGRLYMHPEHWTNIISRVNQGAGLHGWDGVFPGSTSDDVIVQPFLQFPHDGKSSPNPRTFGETTAAGTLRPANAIFNRLSRYEVSFFWNGNYISLGKNAGQESGITYGTPIGQNKGNHANTPGDYCNYFWIWDVDEILSSENLWDAEPKEWGYLDPHIPEIAGNTKQSDGILGGYFDPDESRLWLMTFEQSQGGNLPMILQYRVE